MLKIILKFVKIYNSAQSTEEVIIIKYSYVNQDWRMTGVH